MLWSASDPPSAPNATMEQELKKGLSVWSIAAIVCNSAVGVLILILFVILYKACKVPSRPEKLPGISASAAAAAAGPEQKRAEQKYLLPAA